jgi:hypothetical protein
MRIFVLQENPITLQVDFKQSELEHPLFSTALTKLRNKDYLSVHKDEEVVSVEVVDTDTIETTGVAVDTVRQIFCGDINPGADLSKCPRFVIGDWDEPEPDGGIL